MSSIKTFIHSLQNHPLRGVLVIITITVGVATLSMTTSLSMGIRSALDSSLSEHGRRVTIANGKLNAVGELMLQEPIMFAPSILAILGSEYEKLSDLTMVTSAWIKDIVWVRGKTYQVRSAVQVSETYGELMDLEMAAGSFFNSTDVEARNKVVVISSLTAEILFGSIDSALGQTVALAGKDGLNPYTIVGIYRDVSALEREAYGIADFILPLFTGILDEWKIHPIQEGAVLMARIGTDSVAKTESRIRSILEPEYGDDLQLTVMEGVPGGNAQLIEQRRTAVRNFAFAISVLGFIILATSSVGIFSVMLVEVVGRTRDIGLRRALGTTKAGIRRFFIGQALFYSLIGSVIGTLLSSVFYRDIGMFLEPLFASAGIATADAPLTLPGPIPVIVAVGSALVFGALFGFFPAMTAARMPIIECIREDTT